LRTDESTSTSRTGSRGRSSPAWLLWAAVLLPGTATAIGSENGGTGLVAIDRASSLPASGMFVSTYANLLDNKFTPGQRLFTFTPSVTKGLGGGFEISGTLPFSGSSSDLPGDFSKRIDVRGRDLGGNVRWTTPLGTSRLRVGGQGLLNWPILSDKTRPGGTQDPDNGFDVGVKGLLSMEFGNQTYPMQLHVNGGYWWSRDDGAFYYQNSPVRLPLAVAPGQKNDVLTAGVALQGGLNRMTLFTELTTQQLLDARGQIRSSENLWRLTPGVRTKITSSIAATAALTFNLATDSDRTSFDPETAYPEVEFQFGLTLGQVIRRMREVPSLRTPVAKALGPVGAPAAAAGTGSAGEIESAPGAAAPVDATGATPKIAAPSRTPSGSTSAAAPAPDAAAALDEERLDGQPHQPAPFANAVPAAAVQPSLDQRIARISRRLDQLEMIRTLDRIESRLATLETRGGAARTAAAAEPTSGSSSPDLSERMDALQLQLQQLQQSVHESTAQPTPTTAPKPAVSSGGVQSAITSPGRVAPAEGTGTPVATEQSSERERELVARIGRLEGELESRRREMQGRTSGSTLVVPVPTPPQVPTPIVVPAPPPATTVPAPASTISNTFALRAEAERELARSRALRGAVEAPADSGAATSAAPATLQHAEAIGFPLDVGAKVELEIDLAKDRPDTSSSGAAVLDEWARHLSASPSTRVLLLVYGAGGSRSEAATRTERQAKALREHILGAGVRADQIAALGMGLADQQPGDRPRVVLERVR